MMYLCLLVYLLMNARFRDATSALKIEALELQRQRKHLQYQYDMLQASAIIQGRRSRVAATSMVNGQLANIDDSLSVKNLEVACC